MVPDKLGANLYREFRQNSSENPVLATLNSDFTENFTYATNLECLHAANS